MKWTRQPWNSAANEALHDLIAADKRRVLDDLEQGRAELFCIEGDQYQGWLLTRIEEQIQTGDLDLHVLAFRGRGSAALLADLKRIARQSGCRTVSCEAHDPAVQRLWTLIGFDELERRYQVEA